MRPESEYRAALSLIDQGMNDSAVGRKLGIPRETVREWRKGHEQGGGGRTRYWTGRTQNGGNTSCFRCRAGFFDAEAYAYLLGIYLGDGHLTQLPREVFRLRVTCDLKYPDIVNEIATHIIILTGKEQVSFVPREGCVDVSSYWKHWICLFPQHGPGRKHERAIKFSPWQEAIAATHPQALVRELLQSDGNRHINEVERRLSSGTKRYRYPRYMFTNASADILGIFTDALDQLGVHWTRTTPRIVSVARREDVRYLDTFVGPKR